MGGTVQPGWEGDGRAAWRAVAPALAVLLISLLFVAVYARTALDRERQLGQARLAEEATQVVDLLSQRLIAYESSTRGGASLFASLERPSAEHWRAYVGGLREGARPGVDVLGYAPSLTGEELAALRAAGGDASASLARLHPPGLRERHGPVVYLEPLHESNADVLGYDMLADVVSRRAMEEARDRDEPRMSGRLQLQRRGTPDGVILYTPVYRAGGLRESVETRREAVRGWVFAPVPLRELVVQALAPLRGALHLRVLDVTGSVPELLYADADFDAVRPAPGRFHTASPSFYGRTWRLDFVAREDAGGAFASPLRISVAVGVLASLLLAGLVWSLSRNRAQAQRLAEWLGDSYRRSESRFRSAMAYSPVGEALLDGEGRVVDANPALAAIAGLPLERLLGARLEDFFADAREVGGLEAQPHAQDGVYRASRILRRGDGGRRRVRLSSAPLPGDVGSDVEQLVQIDDVTDWYRAEERVRALNRTLEARVAARTRELERANRELEAFSYSVSHDLRAPLRSLDGFSRRLLERHAARLDDEGRDYLARIRAAAGRMDALIDALLQMAHLSRATLERQPLDLGAIAAQVEADLRHGEPQRRVEVRIHDGLAACGDPALVANLLQNLVGNAWKFTGGRADARIEVGRERRADGAEAFFVRDNGAGFAPEQAARLFRPFQRLHAQEDFPGHGIGLASVRRVVERHGGEVWAEGRPGQGACFWFTLPDAPAGAEAQG
nr:CHASE domain-containing protein [Luteimonas sp. Y-2-2-4F]